jgi:hypothetical protein
MTNVRLTARGKFVVAVLVVLAVFTALSVSLNAVTPKECNVSVENMSQGCKSLIYK